VHIDYPTSSSRPLLLGALPNGEEAAGGAPDGSVRLELLSMPTKRVASTRRSMHKGRTQRKPRHMTKSHVKHAEWTPQRRSAGPKQTGPTPPE